MVNIHNVAFVNSAKQSVDVLSSVLFYQYSLSILHSRNSMMLQHFGFTDLADNFRKFSSETQSNASAVADRALLLGGDISPILDYYTTNAGIYGNVNFDLTTVLNEAINTSITSEELLSSSILLLNNFGDYFSANILQNLLESTINQINWLNDQISLIA